LVEERRFSATFDFNFMIQRLIGAAALLLFWVWFASQTLSSSEMKESVPTVLAAAAGVAVSVLVPVCRKGEGYQKIAGWTLLVPAIVFTLFSFAMAFRVWRPN
jgi:hypothetical protein